MDKHYACKLLDSYVGTVHPAASESNQISLVGLAEACNILLLLRHGLSWHGRVCVVLVISLMGCTAGDKVHVVQFWQGASSSHV